MATNEEKKILWTHLQRAIEFLQSHKIIHSKHSDPNYASFKKLFQHLLNEKKIDLNYHFFSYRVKNLFDKDGNFIKEKPNSNKILAYFNELLPVLDDIIKEEKNYYWSINAKQYLALNEKNDAEISPEVLTKIVGVYVGFFPFENNSIKQFVFSISQENFVLLKSEHAESTGRGGIRKSLLWFTLFSKFSDTPELIIVDVRQKLNSNSSRLNTFAAVSAWFDPASGDPTCSPCQMIRVGDEPVTEDVNVTSIYEKVRKVDADLIKQKLKGLGPSYFKLTVPDL